MIHKLSENFRFSSLLSPAAITASAAMTARNFTDGGNNITATVNVGAITGTTVSYTAQLQSGPSASGPWTTLDSAVFLNANANQFAVLSGRAALTDTHCRINEVVSGTTPSILRSIVASYESQRSGATLNSNVPSTSA